MKGSNHQNQTSHFGFSFEKQQQKVASQRF
jgi:hypothetical protein